MAAWFPKKDSRSVNLQPGFIYRNVRAGGNVIETAKVLSVTPECTGIPHVRFAMTLDSQGHIRLSEASRILSVAAFTQQFPQRVPA